MSAWRSWALKQDTGQQENLKRMFFQQNDLVAGTNALSTQERAGFTLGTDWSQKNWAVKKKRLETREGGRSHRPS